MRISLDNFVGLYCVSYRDSLRVAELISFYEPENIILDFKSVEVISTVFLNAVVNSITKKYSVDYIKSFLQFDNLPNSDYEAIIDRVLIGSYNYNNNPEYKKLVDDAVQKEIDNV